MRIALVTPTMKSGERGGAEALYAGLLHALRAAGYNAEQIEVVIDESTFDAIQESYARCAALDLSRFDLVISTKAPTYMVRHPRHVSYLLHTLRVFYDMFEREFGEGTADHRRQRAIIHRLDKEGLDPRRIRAHFANGRTTFQRLYDIDPWWQRIAFEALHHPPALEGFVRPRRGEHVLLPGRLHRWKRADLVIDAFAHVKAHVPLKIVGTGEDEAALRARAAGDPRIEFLGHVSESALVELYAGALAVPFVPRFEDYGLITIEAFNSRKPVITCTDSGETLEFVRDGETGFVTAPDPRAIAERIDWLAGHRAAARAMGERGRRAVAHITWDRVVRRLIAAATEPSRIAPAPNAAATPPTPPRVAILDMQPIAPAIGGSRVRLLGLFHGLGLPATYTGTYDWRGEARRRVRHSDTLEETTVPLSAAHFDAADAWQRQVPGASVIDISFPRLAEHSPDYLAAAADAMADAEIVVFAHPWVYPLVKDRLDRTKQLVVYDAHNVESVLRATLLGRSALEVELARDVAAVERDLCQSADLILACSHDDRLLFHELYDVPFANILVAPNGTFVNHAGHDRRADAKAALGLTAGPVAIFLGSEYGPNVEAARFIAETLAVELPHVTFVICGGVGAAITATSPARDNLRVTGVLSDDDKAKYFAAADLAVNPMFSGSGTNVKMFDFMAAELPVVTTPVGARGILQGSEPAFRLAEPAGFVDAIRTLIDEPAAAAALGAAGRRLVQEKYSWERVSAQVGLTLTRRRAALNAPAPRFSVIVATYDRHDRLPHLLDRLAAQTCSDFEVIIVDQTSIPWEGRDAYPQLDICYIHTDIRGATKARNTAAFAARGAILAFTDDDCVPDRDWLERASPYFDQAGVVGVEGLIASDKLGDPNYRTVSNVGFEGVGFMTANLFLRRETFLAIDGFDERFDNPHFREDTDLAWRALPHGAIPYARDVRVFHPPHRRDVAREGHAERNTFFEKDALLFHKHPQRYRALMATEGHFRATNGFADHVRRGAAKYGVDLALDPRVEWLVKSSAVRALLETSHE
jgi:glycosyltransferase involved in cell wall biosynthesis/GT2 family glycosyltransferase